MRKKTIAITLLTWLIASMFGIAFTTKPANASPGDPWLEVKPNSYITSEMETFNVSVWLNDITADKRMIGFGFRLLYDDTLLEVLNVTEGPFLPSFNNTYPPPYTLFTWFNETDGFYGPHVLVGDVLLNDTVTGYTVFPEGSGLIAIITFRGIYPIGNCILELVDIQLTDTDFNLISTSAPKDGYYEIWPLCGDVNHDRRVDIRDVVLVARAFGSFPGDPKWNPRYDFNRDEKIDIRDLAIFKTCFGDYMP